MWWPRQPQSLRNIPIHPTALCPQTTRCCSPEVGPGPTCGMLGSQTHPSPEKVHQTQSSQRHWSKSGTGNAQLALTASGAVPNRCHGVFSALRSFTCHHHLASVAWRCDEPPIDKACPDVGVDYGPLGEIDAKAGESPVCLMFAYSRFIDPLAFPTAHRSKQVEMADHTSCFCGEKAV